MIGFLAASLLLAATARAEPLRLPEPLRRGLQYTRLETEMFRKAETGELGPDELLEAALIAGGVGDEQALQDALARYRRWADRLQSEQTGVKALRGEAGLCRRTAPPRASKNPPHTKFLAARVLAFMHREILTASYDINVSQLDQVFASGKYNCVSATILYNCLAAEVGLKARGRELPAHVLSVVETDQGSLEVETTCPRWFDPSAAGQAQESPRQPARSLTRNLNERQLVALVYYNQGIDCSQQRRYAAAIAANFKALRLDPASSTARGNLLAAVNNWALDLAEARRFEQAIGLLRQGRQMAPDHPTYATNLVALHQQWVQSLCHGGQYAQAMSLLEQAAREFPRERFFEAALPHVHRQANEASAL